MLLHFRHKEKHGKNHATDESKPTGATLDDDQLKKALEEEAAAMNQLKVKMCLKSLIFLSSLQFFIVAIYTPKKRFRVLTKRSSLLFN